MIMNEKYTKILELSKNFNPDVIYWDRVRLEPFENSLRSYPAKWIRKTHEFLRILEAKTIVEIGSTRIETTQKCIDYYNRSFDVKECEAPPCCQDGHSTYFWAKEGYEVYTVDIDPHCKLQLENQYKYHLNEQIPNNLHICIPQCGIEFLKNFDKQIDFLYLDGWDVGSHLYAEKHLEAFITARPKLSPLHLISIDDTDFIEPVGGKDKLLTPYLLQNGYTKIIQGRQSIFINHE